MRAIIKATLLLATAMALTAQGELTPYSTDGNTLHLWHLDGTANPLSDSAGSLNLFNWGTSGTFAVDSVADLNKAYESSTSGNSDLQSNGSIAWTNELMGTDGAFTWEMVLRPDEAANSGAGSQMLMIHSSVQMQLKLYYAATGYLYLSLYNNEQGTLVNQRLDGAGLGVNQYATNEWFHLAFTYNGTDTGTIYWTKLGDEYTGTANELVSFSMTDLSLSDNPLAFGGNAALGGNVFNGAIDEIRISDIARDAVDFLQPPLPLVPYTADAQTLQLFHLEETNAWYQNSVADSTMLITTWGGGTPQRDAAGYTGLGYAFETDPTVANRLESQSNEVWATEMMGADGAFTWEMVLKPNKAIDSNSGEAAAKSDQIMTAGGGTTMQLKIVYATAGTASLNLYKNSAGESGTIQFNLNASNYTPGEWYHLAVTYDGNENTADNVKIYWTPLAEYTGTVTQAKSGTWTTDFDGGTQKVRYLGNSAVSGVFDGAIDEIRVSSIARGAGDFLAHSSSETNASAYASWISGYDVGSATNLTDNPDNDSLDNLAEFALGGNPSDPQDTGRPITAQPDGNHFIYVYPQRSDAAEAGLDYFLNWSDNLTGTPWTNNNYEVIGTNDTGQLFDYVSNRVSTATLPVQFLKLVIESE